MTNSSWTQAHIKSLIAAGRSSFAASLFLMDAKSISKARERGETVEAKAACEVVYPPCDTAAFLRAKLDGRQREIVSLAQFRYVAPFDAMAIPLTVMYRPEKDHAKQIHAIAHLFKEHPEYRSGAQRVKLVMMGGARDRGDEQRLEGLKRLAAELNVQASLVEDCLQLG